MAMKEIEICGGQLLNGGADSDMVMNGGRKKGRKDTILICTKIRAIAVAQENGGWRSGFATIVNE
jgi:hypothetical protein